MPLHTLNARVKKYVWDDIWRSDVYARSVERLQRANKRVNGRSSPPPSSSASRFMGPVMPKSIEPDAYAEYRRCFSNPATIHASCEDYRAAASIDLAHDEANMDKKILCPVLVLWGANGLVGKKYDVLAIWRDRATHVTGKALPSSHWLAEEVPDETLAEVKRFLAA